MEKEHFLSGYCRTADQSRTVTVVTQDGTLIEVDCCYKNCVHAPSCPIATEIKLLTEEN